MIIGRTLLLALSAVGFAMKRGVPMNGAIVSGAAVEHTPKPAIQ